VAEKVVRPWPDRRLIKALTEPSKPKSVGTASPRFDPEVNRSKIGLQQETCILPNIKYEFNKHHFIGRSLLRLTDCALCASPCILSFNFMIYSYTNSVVDLTSLCGAHVRAVFLPLSPIASTLVCLVDLSVKSFVFFGLFCAAK